MAHSEPPADDMSPSGICATVLWRAARAAEQDERMPPKVATVLDDFSAAYAGGAGNNVPAVQVYLTLAEGVCVAVVIHDVIGAMLSGGEDGKVHVAKEVFEACSNLSEVSSQIMRYVASMLDMMGNHPDTPPMTSFSQN